MHEATIQCSLPCTGMAPLNRIWVNLPRKMIKGGFQRRKSPVMRGEDEEEMDWAFDINRTKVFRICKVYPPPPPTHQRKGSNSQMQNANFHPS